MPEERTQNPMDLFGAAEDACFDRAKSGAHLERALDKLENALYNASGYILLVVTAVVCADVFMRYVFNSPFRNTIPISELLEVLIVSMGGCYLLREEGFVTIDLLVSRLRPPTRYLLVGVTSWASALALLVLAYGAAAQTLQFMQTKAVFLDSGGWRRWIFALPINIFYFLLSLEFLRRGARYFRARKLCRQGGGGETAKPNAAGQGGAL